MLVVVATMRAREGSEDKLRDVLLALVVESRLEPGCHRYELLMGDEDTREFGLYEQWENQPALNAHLRSRHISVGYSLSDELLEAPAKVVSYRVVEPAKQMHTGPTRPLSPSDPSS